MRTKEKEKENGSETRTRTRSYAIAGTIAIAFALLTAIMVMPATATTVTTVTIFPSDKDAYVIQFIPDANNYDTELAVLSWSNMNFRTLIHFDLSSLPAGATIDSATLHLYMFFVIGDRTIDIHRITASWTEIGVTWDSRDTGTPWFTPGGDYNPTPTSSASTGTTADVWVEWDVTSNVQAFVDGTSNHGWLIKDNVEDEADMKASGYWQREWVEAGKRPKLEVTYTAAAKPDINVTAITTPAKIYANESNSINATIANIDTGDAGPFNVSLSAAGNVVDRTSVAGLAVGASTEVSFKWTPSHAGTYELCVVADCDAAVDERDETNNVTCMDVDVEDKPDLNVTAITMPAKIYANESNSINATIANIDTGDAGPFNVSLSAAGNVVDGTSVAGLAAGASTDVSFEWTPPHAGTYELCVVADCDAAVEESDETNNVTCMDVDVEAAKPDLVVTDINAYHWDGAKGWSSPWFNLMNGIDVTVKNNGGADAGASYVSLYNEDEFFGKLPVSGLSVGASETVTFENWKRIGEDPLSWTDTAEGAIFSYADTSKEYTLKAVADEDEEVSESTESNNNMTVPETVTWNGYMADEPLENYAHGKVRGGIIYTTGDGYYHSGEAQSPGTKYGTYYEVNYDLEIPSDTKLARLYFYYTWAKPGGKAPKVGATLKTPSDDIHVLNMEKSYSETKGSGAWNLPWGTYAYDITEFVTESGTYVVNITNLNDPDNFDDRFADRYSFAAPAIVVVYENETMPERDYWINEGADVLIGGRRGDGGFLAWWECINNATFPASSETREVVNATLGVVSPWAGSSWTPGTTNYLYFNDIKLGTGVYHDTGYDKTIDSLSMKVGGGAQIGVNVTSVTAHYIKGSDNVVGQVDDGDCMMPVNAFLVVEYKAIPANVRIEPEVLNLKNEGVGVFTAFISLPEPYNITDIDNTTVKCECVPATDGVAADDKMYVAKFDREKLKTCVESGDEVELTVTGMLTTGETFEGSDTISVIAP